MENEKKPRLLLVLKMLQRTDVEHPLNTTEIINKLKQCGVEAERKFGFYCGAAGGRQFHQ
ncbi:hypothetical protein [Ruminiclostridium cellobioparum]|uniref:hypothetical protein n=1 Tax=Ruminiclostridium cellobioparum TaxID=29355 RepID=UPI0003494D97|nr:hypothetical protein [Ruminiclostridium cellobioparum]